MDVESQVIHPTKREGEGKEMLGERKNIQTTPIRTYYKHSKSLPYHFPN